MGSPGWMAPEQFAQRPVTARPDIFVWGRWSPSPGRGGGRSGRTVVELVYRIRHELPDLEGLEGLLRALVEACMDKDPEHRPTARTLPLELLGDHADPDPQAAATELPQRSWSPPPAAAPLLLTLPPATSPRPGGGPCGGWSSSWWRRWRRPWSPSTRWTWRRPAGLGPGPATTTGQAAGTTGSGRPPPLCELLGTRGAGGTLGAPAAGPDRCRRGGGVAARPGGAASGARRPWAHRRLHPDLVTPGARWRRPCSSSRGRDDALAMRGQARDDLGDRGVAPDRLLEVTGGELYLLESGAAAAGSWSCSSATSGFSSSTSTPPAPTPTRRWYGSVRGRTAAFPNAPAARSRCRLPPSRLQATAAQPLGTDAGEGGRRSVSLLVGRAGKAGRRG